MRIGEPLRGAIGACRRRGARGGARGGIAGTNGRAGCSTVRLRCRHPGPRPRFSLGLRQPSRVSHGVVVCDRLAHHRSPVNRSVFRSRSFAPIPASPAITRAPSHRISCSSRTVRSAIRSAADSGRIRRFAGPARAWRRRLAVIPTFGSIAGRSSAAGVYRRRRRRRILAASEAHRHAAAAAPRGTPG